MSRNRTGDASRELYQLTKMSNDSAGEKVLYTEIVLDSVQIRPSAAK